MRLKPFLIIFAFVLVCTGFYALLYFTNRTGLNDTSGEIKKNMNLGSYHKIETPSYIINIGDKNKKIMEPIIEFSTPDEKAKLTLSLPADKQIQPIAENNKVSWQDNKREIYFKKVTDPKELPNSKSEKYEFDIILKERPATNVFSYDINTDNLDFVYQPIFEPKSIEIPTHNGKKIIKTTSSVPENIQGSYAVYKKDGKTSKNGNYHTGKAYQVYRPKIVDAKWKETWGKLHVDTLRNKLSVTVENSWLASASYPVTVDPTIGINSRTYHAVITNIGRFRWKLSIEYEIQDDNGNVLGSDVLITEVLPGETSANLFGFFQNYLKQRVAVWLLADGKYTLREQNHDRLTAPHFQKSDNSDDITDEYGSARNARKQLIHSVTPVDFPRYSMTYDEADLLQRPEKIEYIGKGKNRIPTGNIIRASETFKIGNEIIGAGTESLRPNGTDYNNGPWAAYGAGTLHEGVDETDTNDADGTAAALDVTSTAYLALQNTALTTETLNSVDSFVRGSSFPNIDDNGPNDWGMFQGGVRLGTNNNLGSEYWNTLAWYDELRTSITRPGGDSWSILDLDSLQYVLIGYAASGSQNEDGASYISQAYVTINYTVPPTPTPTSTITPTPTPAPKMIIKGGVQF